MAEVKTEKYNKKDCEKLIRSFYLEVMSNKNSNITQLKSTVLGILDEADKAIQEDRLDIWATYTRLAESIWARR